MENVPTAWNDIHFAEGYPGKYIILARRKGNTWYLAGINGTNRPRKMQVSLDFLQGKNYQMSLFSDAKESNQIEVVDKKVSNLDNIEVELLPEGGFVASFQ